MGQIITHNDVAYKVLYQKPNHHFAKRFDEPPRREYLDMFKEWCGADTIIQSETHFIFVQTIPDIDFEMID
jgi:hypothetical protein